MVSFLFLCKEWKTQPHSSLRFTNRCGSHGTSTAAVPEPASVRPTRTSLSNGDLPPPPSPPRAASRPASFLREAVTSQWVLRVFVFCTAGFDLVLASKRKIAKQYFAFHIGQVNTLGSSHRPLLFRSSALLSQERGSNKGGAERL